MILMPCSGWPPGRWISTIPTTGLGAGSLLSRELALRHRPSASARPSRSPPARTRLATARRWPRSARRSPACGPSWPRCGPSSPPPVAPPHPGPPRQPRARRPPRPPRPKRRPPPPRPAARRRAPPKRPAPARRAGRRCAPRSPQCGRRSPRSAGSSRRPAWPTTPARRFATLPRGDKAPKQIARYGSGMVAQVSGYREQITGEAHITQHELEVRLEAQRHEFMAQIAQIQAKAVTKEDAEQRIITHTKGVLAQVRKEHDQRAEAETEEDRKRRRKAFAIHAGIIVGGTVIACLLLAVGLPAVPALAAGAGPPLIQELVDMIAKLN